MLMNIAEMKFMVDRLSSMIVECEKFHPEFTSEKQLMMESADRLSKFFPCTYGTFKRLVEFMEQSIPTRARIDEKHHIAYNRIYKTSNGVMIPDDEPRILFRGRDNLALLMLRYYRQLCVDAGCTEYQLQSMDRMCAEFEQFAYKSPTMKQPGITRGK